MTDTDPSELGLEKIIADIKTFTEGMAAIQPKIDDINAKLARLREMSTELRELQELLRKSGFG